jgi:alkylphosphonate utilization operon protein PhnA
VTYSVPLSAWKVGLPDERKPTKLPNLQLRIHLRNGGLAGLPDEVSVVKDSVGNVLADGDAVTIVKDIKVKGSSTAVKVGTKVRNIRLITPVDGHDIDAKVDGFGSMYLKSSIVKKVL